ncbi:MAG: EpsG family protein, partial [Cetobacterium sp.]
MISYLMIIFMATTIAWLDNVIKIKKNFFFKISLFFLAIIAGLRWEFGNDYIAYYSIYNLNSSSIYNNIELGYKILNKVFYNLGFHFNVMLFF